MVPFRKSIGALIFTIIFLLPWKSEAQLKGFIQQHAAKNELLNSFYAPRDFQPVWNPQNLQALSDFIRRLDAHGLAPSLFQLETWEPYWMTLEPDPSKRASVEVGTTHLALYAIQALAYGFVNPTEVHPKWEPIKRAVTASQFLDQALQQHPSQFSDFLLGKVPPRDPRYIELVKTLARYRQIQSFGGWKPLPDPGHPIGPGSTYKDLELLKARLEKEGDLPETPQVRKSRKTRFLVDQLTSDALKSFQFRHGITPDGYIGPTTLEELNHSAMDRINSIIINIDRLRWMPRAYEESEHVEVNIAEGALRVFNQQRRITTMEVIVGVKGKHQTPVFHGDIRYLIFRPYWNVPPTIAAKELVPEALKGDPLGYMSKNRYEIVSSFGVAPDKTLPVTVENLKKVGAGSLLMRQATGPGNALGLVKFIFPNDNSVYLHDTPDHRLFQQADRDLSHGCVRVSRPDELAEIILRGNAPGQWNRGTVQAAMNDASNPNFKVNLDRPLPVYLMYWTCFIMGDGRIRFDQDIYGHDLIMRQRFGLR